MSAFEKTEKNQGILRQIAPFTYFICAMPDNLNPRLSAIGQIAVTVSDVEKALSFYRDVLGLEFLFSAGPELAFLNAGGVRLMLSTHQGAGKNNTHRISGSIAGKS